MTEAGASSCAKQVVGAGCIISLLYGSSVYYLPVIMWEQGVLSSYYYVGAGELSHYFTGAGWIIFLLLCGSREGCFYISAWEHLYYLIMGAGSSVLTFHDRSRGHYLIIMGARCIVILPTWEQCV